MDTKKLRQKILDLAIRGKLVPQDPNDEPASVLLDKIREEKKQMVKEGKLKVKDIKNDTIIFKGEDNLHYEKFQDGTVKCIEDEIPFDVPKGWGFIRLQNVISLSSGKSIKVRQLKDGGQYPVYGGNGINGYYDEYNVNTNTIVIGRVGFYCGSIHLTETDAWITDNALIVSVKLPIFSQVYLAEILRFLNLGKTSVSTAQPVVSGKGILPLIVPVPPLTEQNRIIKRYFEMIDAVEKIDQDKDSLFQTTNIVKAKIIDLAIKGKLVPQDPNDEPASVLLERIRAEKEELIKQGKLKRDKKESIIYKGDDNSYYEKYNDGEIVCIDEEIPFSIPVSWCFIRFKELFELLSGRDLSLNDCNNIKEGIPYITGASNFQNGEIIINRWTKNPQVITEMGDLLITCKGTVGELSINSLGKAHVARQVMAIKNTFSLNINYIQICMYYYVDALQHKSKGLIPGISREDILKIILPIPPCTEQDRISSCYSKTIKKFKSIEFNLI